MSSNLAHYFVPEGVQVQISTVAGVWQDVATDRPYSFANYVIFRNGRYTFKLRNLRNGKLRVSGYSILVGGKSPLEQLVPPKYPSEKRVLPLTISRGGPRNRNATRQVRQKVDKNRRANKR